MSAGSKRSEVVSSISDGSAMGKVELRHSAWPAPRFGPVVKIARVFFANDQAVHKLVGKVVRSDSPNDSIDVSSPGMVSVIRRSPGEVLGQFLDQLGTGMNEPLFLTAVLSFPRHRPVAGPGPDVSTSIQIRLPEQPSFEPEPPQRRSIGMRRID